MGATALTQLDLTLVCILVSFIQESTDFTLILFQAILHSRSTTAASCKMAADVRYDGSKTKALHACVCVYVE